MQRFVVVALAVVFVGLGPAFLEAIQLPLAPTSASGATVTPAFEGWYENPGWDVQPLLRLLQSKLRVGDGDSHRRE